MYDSLKEHIFLVLYIFEMYKNGNTTYNSSVNCFSHQCASKIHHISAFREVHSYSALFSFCGYLSVLGFFLL